MMGYKIKSEDIRTIIELYLVKHLSCAKIAKKFGVTRQQIWNILKSENINTSKQNVSYVKMRCSWCNKTFKRRRCIFLKSNQHFCSLKCYHEYLKSSPYIGWRQGQRIAREVIRSLWPEIDILYPNWVVHHIDGNCKNNHISNLMAFACQRDHLRWHRSNKKPKPIFDGSKILAYTD